MNNKKVYFRIMQMLKPYKRMIILSMLLSVLITLVNVAIPIVQQKLIDYGLMMSDFKMLLKLTLVLILLAIATHIIMYFNASIQVDLNIKFIRNMQLEVLKHSLKLKAKYLKNDGILKIINDANYNIQSISSITGSDFFSIFLQIFKVVGITIGLMIISWKLAIFVLITIPLRLIISNVLSKAVSKATDFSINIHRKMHKWESDVFQSVNEIKLWNLYSKKIGEYENLLVERDKTSKKLGLMTLKEKMLGEVTQNVIFDFIYIISAFMIWDKHLSLGGLLAFISYSNYLMEPIALIATVKMVLGAVEPSIQSYDEFLNLQEEESEIEEKGRAKIDLTEKFEVCFENVCFGYEESFILQNVNLNLCSGEKVALIGDNGSGKTTLINLLLRFYSPSAGRILIDNVDIENIKLNNYRQLFSVVSQFPNLFQGTIYENITVFGENDIDKEKLKRFDLLRFVYEMPHSLETFVGNESGNISGGEKQKIALIRALGKKNSKILILDEATSNYDVQSLADFEKLLAGIDKGIVILITHKPEMLKLVDKIIEVRDGGATVYRGYEDFYENSVRAKDYINKEGENTENECNIQNYSNA